MRRTKIVILLLVAGCGGTGTKSEIEEARIDAAVRTSSDATQDVRPSADSGSEPEADGVTSEGGPDGRAPGPPRLDAGRDAGSETIDATVDGAGGASFDGGDAGDSVGTVGTAGAGSGGTAGSATGGSGGTGGEPVDLSCTPPRDVVLDCCSGCSDDPVHCNHSAYGQCAPTEGCAPTSAFSVRQATGEWAVLLPETSASQAPGCSTWCGAGGAPYVYQIEVPPGSCASFETSEGRGLSTTIADCSDPSLLPKTLRVETGSDRAIVYVPVESGAPRGWVAVTDVGCD